MTISSHSKRTLESDYQRALLARVSLEFRDHRFFRRNVGLIHSSDDRYFRASLPGQCDLYVLGRGGWHGEVEIKRFASLKECEGMQSKSHRDGKCVQAHWRDWCAAWGVPWLLLEARRQEQPSVTVARWVDECASWLGV